MKKIVLLLFLIVLARSVSALDVGCCCIPNQETVYFETENECTDINPDAEWTGYPYSYIDGQNTDLEFQAYCQPLCEAALDNNDTVVTPPTNTSTVYYALTGTVYNNTLTEPLAGASLYFHMQNGNSIATTGVDGRFSVNNVPEQNYLFVWITHPECSNTFRQFNLTQDIDENIILNCNELQCTSKDVRINTITKGNNYELIINPFTSGYGINQISADCREQIPDPMIKLCVETSCRTIPAHGDIFSDNSVSIDLSRDNIGYDNGGWLDGMLQYHDTKIISLSLGFLFSDGWNFGTGKTFDLGNPLCWKNNDEFCFENQIYECDSSRNIMPLLPEERNDCNIDDRFCYQDTDGAVCKFQEPCTACNGFTGMFPGIFSILTAQGNRSCNYLVTNIAYSSCFLASSFSTKDYYEQCINFDSCYSYTTKSSCGLSPCGSVNSANCEWTDSEPSILGRGICVPEEESFDCTECTTVYGEACGKDMCEGFDDCAYGIRDNEGTCLPKSRFACSDYDTEQECTNNIPSSVNVVYEDGMRIAGTNVLTRSNDTHELGICKWTYNDNLGRTACIRDADGNDLADPCTGEFTDLVCETDINPPTTNFPLAPNSIISLQQLRSIKYLATDNVQEVEDTYFCLAAIGQTCYPTQDLRTLRVDVEGQYLLKYYSADPAGNLELIHELPLTLMNTSVVSVIGVTIEGLTS